MAKEKIVNKGEIIFIHQIISILSYNQYILAIKRRVKDQAQIFEVKTNNCQSEKIRLTNFYILAKSPKHIKIPIYNIIEDVIEIPKGTTIGYLSTEVEEQPPNPIPDFSQLCGYIRRMLFASTKTIGTDKFGKSRPITAYAA
ncbi:hypothetical protein G9A89_011461 [Geosiphon pyriformis]|nr:hypothetical protein G9A89_011461 [Geosiphon pyriformis]